LIDVTQLEIILYVSDQSRSRDVYSAILDQTPLLDVPGMTEFVITDSKREVRLGLMPIAGIQQLLPAIPFTNTNNPRAELYIVSEDALAISDRAIAHGATVVRPLAPMDWGDTVVYLADPDGHILALAKKTTS
jgi:predicted enzyme related to lactoylglutathione lyase